MRQFKIAPILSTGFPLDYFGEYKTIKEKSIKCLHDNNFENTLYRNKSKEYLNFFLENPYHVILGQGHRHSLLFILMYTWKPCYKAINCKVFYTFS
uniref:Uncharacterized protein n=1 Tax=Vombatus ursinus TaxID=29139 RepID=A0A4X2L0H3_VOMUR